MRRKMSGTARSGLFLTARRGLLTSDRVIGRDIQPGEPVAAAGAAEENRPLVAHELAAAAGENRRTPDQARPILLAAAGGESPHAAAVWGHAAQDRGAPITSRIGES